MGNSRTKNAFFNIFTSSFSNIASILISFANRVIFLHFLNATYLGVSGLFSNILLIFSFVELGIGAALTQMFYKPFAEKDYEQLSKVTYTTRKLLNIVGIVVIALTLIFTPMLQLFVNDIDAVPHMRLIFMLYGFSSAVTYFLGFYRTIITANQQAYKLVKFDILWKFVVMAIQALVLALTKNFIVYLIASIILSYFINFIIMLYVKKKIPEINYKCKTWVSKEERKELFKNVAGLSMNRLALVITEGTDNILISKFLDLVIVGLSSNYTMIQQSVNSLVESLFGPLLASVGNLCVTETDETKYVHFKHLSFAAFWLYGFCSITMFVLADPFIKFVFGDDYVIPKLATLMLSACVFATGLYRVPSLFRTAQGLFWYGRFRPLLQALVNLISSLILISTTHKLWTVYLGTLISLVVVTIWYEPYIVLKHGLKQNGREYYFKLLVYIVMYLVGLYVTNLLAGLLSFNGILELIVKAIICIIVPNIIFIVAFFATKEFKYWYSFVMCLVRKKLSK